MAHHHLTKVTEVTTPLAPDIWQKLTQTTIYKVMDLKRVPYK